MRRCKFQSLLFVIQVNVVYVSNKSPLIGEHAFLLAHLLAGWLAYHFVLGISSTLAKLGCILYNGISVFLYAHVP